MVIAALLLAASAAAAERTLRCAGAATMQDLLARWSRAFTEHEPHHLVRVDHGATLSADGFEALLAGRADCVAFARELFPSEVAAYVARFGVEPRPVPVAGGSFATLHATHAIAIYVNATNPLAELSSGQLETLFAATSAAPKTWGQMGLKGRWTQTPIHLIGMMPYRASGNPPGIVNFLRLKLLHGRDFRNDVQAAGAIADESPLQAIVRYIAADPAGIGYSGFGFAMRGVKTIAISAGGDGRYVAGTPASVQDRQYPLARTLYLLFDPRPEFGPIAKAFGAYALSPAGQALVARDAMHFVALSGAEHEAAHAVLDSAPKLAAAARQTRNLAPYTAAPVHAPPDARYITPSGAIAIIGYNDMRAPLAAIDALFSALHPGYRFSLKLEGTRTAPAALMRGTSLFAPMGAPFEDDALAAYRGRVGADPLMIRVAHAAIDPAARSSPLAVFVHRDNPLDRLTLRRLAAVFAPPAGQRPAMRWGDLGVRGTWAARPIHAYGLLPQTALGTFLRREVFGGRKFAPGYMGLQESHAVIARALADPNGMAIADLNQGVPGLKIVPLARCARCAASRGTVPDLIAGRYPLDRYLYLYLRQVPGRGIDPLAREYLRLMLSREGQTAITASPPHYLPLNAREAAEGLAALQ